MEPVQAPEVLLTSISAKTDKLDLSVGLGQDQPLQNPSVDGLWGWRDQATVGGGRHVEGIGAELQRRIHLCQEVLATQQNKTS